MKIGIIAALPGELRPLVKGWKRLPAQAKGVSLWTIHQDGDEIVAACGGMGAEAARQSLSAAESAGPLDIVLSVGWAGAIDSGMRIGECYIPSEVIDVQTGERFPLTDGCRTLRLVTSPVVADNFEKRRLWSAYDAALVDMEAATIARLAAMRGVPFCCFKGVSDGTEATLPDLNRFIDDRGQMRMRAFLWHIAIRPRFWKPLLALGRNSSLAAESLASKVQRFLLETDVDRITRTGAV